MSDSGGLPRAKKPLPTSQEFRRFLSVKHTKECPSCGSNQWTHIAPGEGFQQFEMFYKVQRHSVTGQLTYPTTEGARVLAVWAISCSNCGLMLSYNNNIVETWLDQNPSTKDGK